MKARFAVQVVTLDSHRASLDGLLRVAERLAGRTIAWTCSEVGRIESLAAGVPLPQRLNEAWSERVGEVEQLRLVVSPTSESWSRIASVTGELPPDVDWKARSTAAGYQELVVWNELEACPTVLQALLEGPVSVDVVSRAAEQLGVSGVAGFASGDNVNSLWLNVLEELGPWPRALQMLDEKVDRQHDVVVFATRTGAALPVLARANEGRFKDLVVHRGEDVAVRLPDALRGEFALSGGRRLFSRARREQLEREGMVFDRGEGTDRLLVVEDEHCRQAGLDPSAMIEVAAPSTRVREYRATVRAEFQRLAPSSRAEILAAYRRLIELPKWGRSGFFGAMTAGVLDVLYGLFVDVG